MREASGTWGPGSEGIRVVLTEGSLSRGVRVVVVPGFK